MKSDNVIEEDIILSDIPEINGDSFYKDNILYYIAGYIVFKVILFIKCKQCRSALIASQEHFYSKGVHSFTVFKNRGGLHVPSLSVFKILKETEKCIQYLCKDKNLRNLRVNTILYNVKKHLLFDDHNSIFPDLSCEDKLSLFDLICKRFIKIRFYSLEQTFTDRVTQRNKNLKLTLFRNE